MVPNLSAEQVISRLLVMEVLYIGIVRPSILPPTILTTILFKRMKVLKCLQLMEDVDIGLSRPSTLPLSIVEFIIVLMMLEADIGLKKPANINILVV